MPRHGKRYRKGAEGIEAEKAYGLPEAISVLKAAPVAKFDESVELAINLGVDPKHADQMVRGALVLPHGTGKGVRVLVFAKGDKEKEATEAGADYVGAEDLAKKIQQEGWLEFDRVIASPDMMSVVVTADVGGAVRDQKAGKVEYRVDKNGIIHAAIGRVSFGEAQLLENASALIDAVVRAKPSAAKGTYVKKISLSTTMGPGIRIDPWRPRRPEETLVLTRQQKENEVTALRDRFARATSVIVVDYRGVDVQSVNSLRGKLRSVEDESFEYRVTKNTLLRRAVASTDAQPLEASFEGPTAVAFAYGDPARLAKILVDYAKTEEAFELKAGFLDGRAIGTSEIETLATLPSLDELRGRLVGLLLAPATKLAQIVQAPGAQLARLVEARRKDLEASG
jgi:large subunit ribosomal protein L1